LPAGQLVERRAPSWVNCELCKCQGIHSRARFVIAEDETAMRASPELPELMLLCADCSAVAEGAIDASEWKRRKIRPNSERHTHESAIADDPVPDGEDPGTAKINYPKTLTSERPAKGLDRA
jgi:hypothetical protein